MLSDPLLHRLVYGLMIKLFWRLVSSLKQLGVNIIYADFNKIILNTPYHTIKECHEYIDFILTAIANKDTFTYLQVST